jgi:DNA-binding CsgD family transcriptional regulator
MKARSVIDVPKGWWEQDHAVSGLTQRLSDLRFAAAGTDFSAAILDTLVRGYAVERCSVVLWGLGDEASFQSVGLGPTFWTEWQGCWRLQDGVVKAVFAEHTASHNLLVYSEQGWKNAAIYRKFMARFGIYYYLSAPLYGPTGAPRGLINLYRAEQARAFDDNDLTKIRVCTAYLSTALACVLDRTSSQPTGLAPRELEVAKLAARGLDNLQISEKLGLARDTVKKTLGRVYEKLDVRGRTQMTANLVRRGLL